MRAFHKHRPALGAQPGSLVMTAHNVPPRIEVLDFGAQTHETIACDDPEQCRRFLDAGTVSWIDVQGLGDHAVLQSLAEIFSIHPLALEDAVNVPVRPKSEVYENFHLVVLRMARLVEDAEIERSQVTLFIGDHHLLVMQESPGDVFDPVRRRTRTGNRMRESGPDYLAYALVDLVIDGYYPVLERIGIAVEELEGQITRDVHSSQLGRIQQLRHQLQELRRDMLPMRDLVWAMMREESPFVRESTIPFLRDCHDHASQLAEVIDGYVEQTTQLMNLHSAMMSNRMNEIMKVLTMMSTVFIPLGFLAGLYGMNFENMPELGWRYAYFVVLGLMFVIGLGLLVLFRRRGWWGQRN